jgi:hypothetical protein
MPAIRVHPSFVSHVRELHSMLDAVKHAKSPGRLVEQGARKAEDRASISSVAQKVTQLAALIEGKSAEDTLRIMIQTNFTRGAGKEELEQFVVNHPGASAQQVLEQGLRLLQKESATTYTSKGSMVPRPRAPDS